MRCLALGLLAVFFASAASAEGALDPRVQAVIDRTRTTHAEYSVYAWNRVTPQSGAPREEWSAEFNKGQLHRVETPRDRLIADCEAQSGTYFGVETGKLLKGPSIARAACGIQANAVILSAKYDGSFVGPFGQTDRITIHDSDGVRRYQVTANGVIVGATIESEDGHIFLSEVAVGLETRVPSDIFSEASLSSSAVPEKYRQKLL